MIAILDVCYGDNALILKMVGKESIVDEVVGTVDINFEISQNRLKRVTIRDDFSFDLQTTKGVITVKADKVVHKILIKSG